MLTRHMNASGDFIVTEHMGLKIWLSRNEKDFADLIIEHEGERLNITLDRKRTGIKGTGFYATFDGPRSFDIKPSQHLIQHGSGHDTKPGTQQVSPGKATATTLLPESAS